MNYLALKGEVSDFSLKNLSLDRKLSILRGFIPRNLCIDKKFALKLPREPVSGFLGIIPALSNKYINSIDFLGKYLDIKLPPVYILYK
jgi:hypothetical protein